jgi:hypothetical protein
MRLTAARQKAFLEARPLQVPVGACFSSTTMTATQHVQTCHNASHVDYEQATIRAGRAGNFNNEITRRWVHNHAYARRVSQLRMLASNDVQQASLNYTCKILS